MAFADEVAALMAEVQLQYSTDHLRSLTNPQLPNNVGIDVTTTGKLYRACTTVCAFFQTLGECLFDSTDVSHMAHGVEGVEVVLMVRMGQVGAKAELNDWKDGFEPIRRTGPRKHIELDSTSNLTVVEEGDNGETARPWAQQQNFRGLVADAPNQQDQEFFDSDT